MKLSRFFLALSSLFFSSACAHQGKAEKTAENEGHHAPHAHGEKAHAHVHDSAHHAFKDPERWSQVFDSEERSAWQKPEEVLAHLLQGRSDLHIADIGAGTGYFSLRFAKHLSEGQVSASDLEKDMLDFILERAEKEGLSNIKATLASPEDPGLSETYDLIFLSNTYHHIENRSAYFQALLPRLKEGGRIAILDFKPESPKGPPKHHKLAAEVVDQEMDKAGYERVDAYGLLEEQYLLSYSPKKQ